MKSINEGKALCIIEKYYLESITNHYVVILFSFSSSLLVLIFVFLLFNELSCIYWGVGVVFMQERY